jgi:hypothetical protein
MSARPALRAIGRVALPLALFALTLTVIALLLGDHADIIKKTMSGGGSAGDLKKVTDVVGNIKGPANVTFGSLVPLGILAGGALLAFGNRKGVQLIATSAAAGAVVLLANGVAA